jgi:trans-aconitate methyltransferase
MVSEVRRERWNLDAVRQRRLQLRLAESVQPLLGFAELREQFAAKLATPEGTSLLALVGSAGVGKTALLSAFMADAGANVVSARAALDELGAILDPAGSDVGRLIHAIHDRVSPGIDALVVTYDDVDTDLLPEGTQRFIRELVHRVDVRLIVLTATTAPETAQMPVPATIVRLDRRRASEAEFSAYLDHCMSSLGISPDEVPDDVRDVLFSLQEQTTDFRSFTYILEMLAAIHKSLGKPINTQTVYRLLSEDSYLQQFRSFPGVTVTDDRRLTFRRKDKTELLCDVLMRVYESPREFVAVASQELPAFARSEFLADAEVSFRDALMSLCLTRSPLDIINNLLGPRDLLREVEALELDKSRLFDAPDARKELLIRGLGFTFVDRPKGLSDYAEIVSVSDDVVISGGQRQEVIKGIGLNLIQSGESLLLDLLQFWAHYLFGSVEAAAKHYNDGRSGQQIQVQRLTIGDVVALLRFIDQGSTSPARALSLTLIGRRRPLTDDLLRAAGGFVEKRNHFVHDASSRDIGDGGVSANIVEIRRLVQELIRAASDAYPAVIKISEIVFDEYSRRIFTGIDSRGATVRFSMTDQEREESIMVASHYYMIPAKRVAMNPVLVPTTGSASRILFDSAEDYDRWSTTQRAQGGRLLDAVALAGRERVLDAGCGSGALTIELAQIAPTLSIAAVDISPEMVKFAAQHAAEAGVNNVTFETVDILSLGWREEFDVVFSNSTMHWVIPPEKGYRKLYDALVRGGQLAVHQGGQGSYRGLWQCALDLITERNLAKYFVNWTYPAYYPAADELEALLRDVGFVDVSVQSYECDGSEYLGLIRDFSNAGLLPFLARLPETERDGFKREFVRTAERGKVDLYTHRLFAFGRRPRP